MPMERDDLPTKAKASLESKARRYKRKPNKRAIRKVTIETELPEGSDPFAHARIKTGTVELPLSHLKIEDVDGNTVRVTRVVHTRDVPLFTVNLVKKLSAALTHSPKPKYDQVKHRIHLVRDLHTRPKGMIVSNFLNPQFAKCKAERESWEWGETVRRDNLSADEMMVAYARKHAGASADTCVSEAIERIAAEADSTPKKNLKTGKLRRKQSFNSLTAYRTWCVGVLDNVIKEWGRTSRGDIEPEAQRTERGVKVLAYADPEAVEGRSRL